MAEGAGVFLRLVRHGETEWSAQRRYTGHTDVSLTSDGIAQAEALGALARDAYESVWCSDLRRCIETARLMGVDARTTAELREFDFGDIEGKRWADLDHVVQQGLLAFDGFVAPGGESVAAFGKRIDAFVETLGSGRHLVVTHGGVIRHLLRRNGRDQDVPAGSWHDLEC